MEDASDVRDALMESSVPPCDARCLFSEPRLEEETGLVIIDTNGAISES